MKFPLNSILAILATGPAVFASPINQVSSTLTKRNGDAPPADQDYFCAVNDKSASVANIDIGIESMRGFGDRRCSAGAFGTAARMAAGDGYSFYIASTNGVPAGEPYCYSVVADAINTLKESCTVFMNGEDRAEGSIWIPGLKGSTYVYITGESK